MPNHPLDLEEMLREAELYDNPLTDKQRDILKAAENLFGELGYGGTSTAEIARAANVTEKTLFKHFRTKADLLKRILFPTLVRTLLPRQLRKMQKMLHGEWESWGDFFAAFAKDRWEVAAQLGPRLKLVVSEMIFNDKFRDEFGPLWREHFWKEFVATADRLKAEGKLRADIDSATIARMQFFIVAGFALTRHVVDPTCDWNEEEEAHRMTTILWEGLRPRTEDG